jgi:hypothetical protein
MKDTFDAIVGLTGTSALVDPKLSRGMLRAYVRSTALGILLVDHRKATVEYIRQLVRGEKTVDQFPKIFAKRARIAVTFDRQAHIKKIVLSDTNIKPKGHLLIICTEDGTIPNVNEIWEDIIPVTEKTRKKFVYIVKTKD